MLRHVIAVSLVLLGTSRINAAIAVDEPTTVACHNACMIDNDNLPSTRDAMDGGIARIAVRASTPSMDGVPLTPSDLLGLYLLLSLPARTQSDTP